MQPRPSQDSDPHFDRQVSATQQLIQAEERRLQSQFAQIEKLRSAAIDKQDQKELARLEQIEKLVVVEYQKRVEQILLAPRPRSRPPRFMCQTGQVQTDPGTTDHGQTYPSAVRSGAANPDTVGWNRQNPEQSAAEPHAEPIHPVAQELQLLAIQSLVRPSCSAPKTPSSPPGYCCGVHPNCRRNTVAKYCAELKPHCSATFELVSPCCSRKQLAGRTPVAFGSGAAWGSCSSAAGSSR